jgi:YNFM family putative membrane transporter
VTSDTQQIVDAGVSPRIARGTPQYRRTSLAIFSCGFSIFALLYCTQPVLPLFSEEFSVSPAQSSLALSLTTITMAIAMIFASSLAEAVGRKPLMLGALIASSLLTLLLAVSTQWSQVLWLRALTGITLSGMPAVALAYLGEEMEPQAVAPAVGLYIGGGALGGMSGRLFVALLADYGSWRLAMAFIGVTGLISAVIFWRALAPSRQFQPRGLDFSGLTLSLFRHFRNPGIVLLVIEGFLLLGGFMVLYNYIGFRLQAPPFNLSQSLAGLVFGVYPIGSLGSALMSNLAARFGRGRMLIVSILIMMAGLALLMPDMLVTTVVGLAVMTFGFFGAHAISSGFAPALAERDKAQASSLYLLFYYIGGGVAGSLGGIFWSASGWTGVALFSGVLMAGTLLAAFLLARMAPSH